MAEGIALGLIVEAARALITGLLEVRTCIKHNKSAAKEIEEFAHALQQNIARLKSSLPASVSGDAIDALYDKLKAATEFVESHQRSGYFKSRWSAKETAERLGEWRRDLDSAFQMALLLTNLEVALDAGKKSSNFQREMLEIYKGHASDAVRAREDLRFLLAKITPMDRQLKNVVAIMNNVNLQASETEKFFADVLASIPSSGVNDGASSSEQRIPNEFCDPITLEPMCDPVKATDGHTYNRWTILDQGLTRSPFNPEMRKPFGIACDDLSLRGRIFETLPSAQTEFRDRREEYRKEAMRLADEGHDADALLMLENVLLWDDNDTGCSEARDTLLARKSQRSQSGTESFEEVEQEDSIDIFCNLVRQILRKCGLTRVFRGETSPRHKISPVQSSRASRVDAKPGEVPPNRVGESTLQNVTSEKTCSTGERVNMKSTAAQPAIRELGQSIQQTVSSSTSDGEGLKSTVNDEIPSGPENEGSKLTSMDLFGQIMKDLKRGSPDLATKTLGGGEIKVSTLTAIEFLQALKELEMVQDGSIRDSPTRRFDEAIQTLSKDFDDAKAVGSTPGVLETLLNFLVSENVHGAEKILVSSFAKLVQARENLVTFSSISGGSEAVVASLEKQNNWLRYWAARTIADVSAASEIPVWGDMFVGSTHVVESLGKLLSEEEQQATQWEALRAVGNILEKDLQLDIGSCLTLLNGLVNMLLARKNIDERLLVLWVKVLVTLILSRREVLLLSILLKIPRGFDFLLHMFANCASDQLQRDAILVLERTLLISYTLTGAAVQLSHQADEFLEGLSGTSEAKKLVEMVESLPRMQQRLMAHLGDERAGHPLVVPEGMFLLAVLSAFEKGAACVAASSTAFGFLVTHLEKFEQGEGKANVCTYLIIEKLCRRREIDLTTSAHSSILPAILSLLENESGGFEDMGLGLLLFLGGSRDENRKVLSALKELPGPLLRLCQSSNEGVAKLAVTLAKLLFSS